MCIIISPYYFDRLRNPVALLNNHSAPETLFYKNEINVCVCHCFCSYMYRYDVGISKLYVMMMLHSEDERNYP